MAYNNMSYNIHIVFTICPIIFTILVIYNDIVLVDNYDGVKRTIVVPEGEVGGGSLVTNL